MGHHPNLNYNHWHKNPTTTTPTLERSGSSGIVIAMSGSLDDFLTHLEQRVVASSSSNKSLSSSSSSLWLLESARRTAYQNPLPQPPQVDRPNYQYQNNPNKRSMPDHNDDDDNDNTTDANPRKRLKVTDTTTTTTTTISINEPMDHEYNNSITNDMQDDKEKAQASTGNDPKTNEQENEENSPTTITATTEATNQSSSNCDGVGEVPQGEQGTFAAVAAAAEATTLDQNMADNDKNNSNIDGDKPRRTVQEDEEEEKKLEDSHIHDHDDNNDPFLLYVQELRRQCLLEQLELPPPQQPLQPSREEEALVVDLQSLSPQQSSSLSQQSMLHYDIQAQIQELRHVYLYGLEQVSKLQDLQKAPDSILPETTTTTNPTTNPTTNTTNEMK
ncbi:hypothetical protein ACA910_008625 [Epithemia clementina (nom. ined.)]